MTPVDTNIPHILSNFTDNNFKMERKENISMDDRKKNIKDKRNQKEKPAFFNEQIGENAGEGRSERTQDDKRKR